VFSHPERRRDERKDRLIPSLSSTERRAKNPVKGIQNKKKGTAESLRPASTPSAENRISGKLFCAFRYFFQGILGMRIKTLFTSFHPQNFPVFLRLTPFLPSPGSSAFLKSSFFSFHFLESEFRSF
jgi:hypothetical protein